MGGISSFPYVVEALEQLLVDDLAARWAGDDTVEVHDGWPAEVGWYALILNGTESAGNEWRVMGGEGRRESYGIRVEIHAAQPGTATREARRRAFDIWSVVEARCRGGGPGPMGQLIALARSQMPAEQRTSLTSAEAVLLEAYPTSNPEGVGYFIAGAVRINGRQ